MRKIYKLLAIAAFVAWVAGVSPLETRGDNVTLTLSTVSGLPGTTVTVDGTITNNGSNTVFLNSEDFTLSSASLLNGDVTDFFLNAPLSLAAGANTGLIALFAFDIAPGTTPGPYGSNFLDVIGGDDPSDFTDTLASAGFTVNVQGTTAAPEPSSLLLLGTGLLALAGAAKFKLLPS